MPGCAGDRIIGTRRQEFMAETNAAVSNYFA